MEDAVPAFQRRPLVQRTPPPPSVPATQMQHNADAPSPGVPEARENPAPPRETIEEMGIDLEALSVLFGGQRHINSLMREELANLVELHGRLKRFSSPTMDSAGTQTSPSLVKTHGDNGSNPLCATNIPNRLRDPLSEQCKSPPKKPKRQETKSGDSHAAAPHNGDSQPAGSWTTLRNRPYCC